MHGSRYDNRYTVKCCCKNNPNSNVKGWNISAPETTRAPGSAFTYNVYPSTDKKSAWIYHIDVTLIWIIQLLIFLQTINGMTLTRLGWVYVPKQNDDFFDTDEFNQTIFGAIVEQCHGLPEAIYHWVIIFVIGPISACL